MFGGAVVPAVGGAAAAWVPALALIAPAAALLLGFAPEPAVLGAAAPPAGELGCVVVLFGVVPIGFVSPPQPQLSPNVIQRQLHQKERIAAPVSSRECTNARVIGEFCP